MSSSTQKRSKSSRARMMLTNPSVLALKFRSSRISTSGPAPSRSASRWARTLRMSGLSMLRPGENGAPKPAIQERTDPCSWRNMFVFGVQQRVFDGTERLGAQSVRSGSRGGRKSGVEALMFVYLLADQTVSIPLDDGREPGRPEGLVEFAPADDAVIGDELEKMIVTPSGIAGQRFDLLDLHRPGSSLGAGSLSTASRWLYSATRPRFTQGQQNAIIGRAAPLRKARPRRLRDAACGHRGWYTCEEQDTRVAWFNAY